MKASLIAVAVLATIAIASGVDEECVQRKLLGLPLHWHNPRDCGSFFRCTNKNIKRPIVCPTGKEYNSRTGRCGPVGKNLCKLSLRLALEEPLNPCRDALSGTFMPDIQNCRDFYICNNNSAYPQSCDAGSYFNTTSLTCLPDRLKKCWANLCLNRTNGAYLPNANDCYAFFICANNNTIAQDCPRGSYFDKDALSCRPGLCPAVATTTPTTTNTISTISTTPSTIVTPTESSTMSPVSTTTTTCISTTTPSTTTCIVSDTTTTTTTCTTTTCYTTPTKPTTTTCDMNTTTPSETTTSGTQTTTTGTQTTTTGIQTTTSGIQTTTTGTQTTTPTQTTSSGIQTTTPNGADGQCAKAHCNQTKCLNADDYMLFPANGIDNFYCMCLNHEAMCRVCPEGNEFIPSEGGCVPSQSTTTTTTTTGTQTTTTTPIVSTTTVSTITSSEPSTTTIGGTTTTTTGGVTTTTTTVGTTTPGGETTTTPSSETTTTPSTGTTTTTRTETTTTPNGETTTTSSGVTTTTSTGVTTTTSSGETTTTSGGETTTTRESTTTTSETTTTTPGNNECAKDNCNQTKCLNAADLTIFPALNGNNKVFCMCLNHEAVCRKCPDGTEFLPNVGACFPIQTTTPPVGNSTTLGTTTSTNSGSSSSTITCMAATTTPTPTTTCAYPKCHTAPCESAADNTSFPYPGSNNAYCLCINKKPVYRECEKDHIYDPDSGECVPESTKPCHCAGEIVEEGESVANPNNCMLFFICYNGELVDSSCGTGNYFNKTTGSCMPDTEGVCPDCLSGAPAKTRGKRSVLPQELEACCPGGYHDGDVIPHPTDCAKKLVCCNGELKEESCGEGYYFNAALKECVKDVNNVCWPPKPSECSDGQVEEHPSNCSMYLACCHGVLVEKSCDPGYYFNPSEKKCVEDVNHVCHPNDKPKCDGGFEEGQIIPNPSNCSSYYKCSNGKFIPQYCDYGFYYSKTQHGCVEDVEHFCWPEQTPSCPGGVEEGEKLENPDNCASYLVCSNGKLVEVSCGNNMYYDTKTKRCELDTNHVCWPKPPSCGGLEEGEKIKNPADCASYLQCTNGVLQKVPCGKDMMFDSKLGQCVPDTNNVCWPKEPTCEEGEKTPNPKNCSSYFECKNGVLVDKSCGTGLLFNSTIGHCVTDFNNVCWPKPPSCKEGEKLPHPSDCATYLVCSNGELEVVWCGKGMYYNSDRKKCEVDSNNVCWPKEPTCEEGEKTPNPHNCSSYFECKNGELIEKSCGKGLLFNSTLGHCVTDFNNVCWPKPPSCKEGEKLPHPSDCATYLVCSNGELEVVWCGKGMYYNSDLKKCEVDSNNVCWPKEPTCEEGEKTPNPKNCSSYFECKNGELIEKSCGKGLLFNSTLGHCVTDFNNVCWPKPPSCKEGEKLPHPSDCATYLVCSNGELEVVWCGKGMYYNSDRKKCEIDSNNVCWPKEPTCEGGVEEGQMVPNPNNCSSYFRCCHGVLMEESCGKGMLFNTTLKQCVPDVNNICWPKEPACKEGEKLPHPTDCATYLKCSNGEYEVVFCGKGLYYNIDLKKCEVDSNNVCWPKEPTCEEGEKTPNPKNCSSYFECKNGELIEKSCGKGLLFNSTLGHCVTDFNNVCWPKPPSCKEGEKLPHPSDCATYLICSNGELKVVWCGKGMYYNSDRKKCEIDSNNVCWPKEPTCEEGEKTPNPHNCSSYFECKNGELIEKSCGKGLLFNSTLGHCVTDFNNVCWPKPPSCKEGEKLPHPSDCATYLVCSNGELEVVWCGKGMYYNSDRKKCEIDSNNVCCPKVPTCEEGEKTPNPKNCSSYFECKNGELIEKSCGKGLLFNSTLGHCVTDFNNVCWPKPPSCKEGEKLPHPSDCATYLVCSNGELEVVWCGKGMYYNSDRKKCEVDSNNVCWPKEPTCEEGEKTPNPHNCSSYFECKNGELIEKSCGKGLLFNSTLGHCVTDFNNVCWPKPPSCKEGEKLPHPSDCATYLVCSNGELEVVWCGKGMYYNSDRKKCEIDSNNVCWPKEPTCEEGEKTPNPHNCSSYFECKNGELIEKSCGKGLLFNSTLGHCVTDFNNVCWPKPPSCKEGEKLPHPSDCATYLVCSNGELEVVWCGKGMYYNSDRKKCEIDSNNVCWPKEPTCEEGEKTPNPKNCSSYFECKNGELIEKSCGIGLLFNSTLGHCVTDFNNVCWPKPPSCKEGEKLPHPSDCATYLVCSNGELEVVWCGKGMYYNSDRKKCEVDSNNVCWPKEPTCEGGVEEGQMVPNPNNCSSYFRCCHGVLMEESCGKGMLFNTTLKQCVPDVNNICWPKEPACKEGEKHPHPTDCATYLKCSNGEYEVVFCGKGLYYNIDLKKCEVDSNNVCWPKPPSCKEGEKLPHPSDCATYLVCSNGELEVVWCGKGMYYNSDRKKCEVDSNNVCWPKEPTCEGGVEEGQMVPNPNNCSSYFRCCHGVLMEESCGKGMLFNTTLKQCVPDVNNICWPKEPACKEGEKLPHPTDCATYLKCSNGEYEVVFCGKGLYYNIDLKKCEVDSNNVCWPKPPSCKEGEKLPHPSDCATYLVCSNGELEVVWCGKGMYYNSDRKKCEVDSNNVCWPKEPTCEGGVEEGQMVPNPNNCSSYFRCCHGVLMEESCGKGMLFNTTLKQCVPDVNNICWPKEPACKEGEKLPHPTDCATYLKCSNGEYEVVFCGKGLYYNIDLKKCEVDSNNVCWPKVPTCEEGEKTPNPKNCSSYFECKNGELIEKSCGKGLLFNSTLGHCVTDFNNVCWPKPPSCKEGEKLPHPSDCATYLICSNGELKVVWCGKGMYYNSDRKKCEIDSNNVCWPKEPTCEEGEKTPNPHNCSSYFECKNGELIEKLCGKGLLFNSTLGHCVTDFNNVCWPKPPSCKEGEKLPHPSDCATYLVCSNGELEVVWCGKGMYYNSDRKKCEIDSNNVCWPKEPTCEEGEKTPNPHNCSSYFECKNGELIEKSCGKGLLFNSTLGHCVTDFNNVCWPKPPLCKEGEKLPHPSDCATYLVCSNGELEVVWCGKGMYYNSDRKKCEVDSNNVCWPKEPTCEGGVEEGQMVPNPNNCSSYFRCCHGVLMEESCRKGMLFNTTLKQCVPDVNNICWPKEPACKEGEKLPHPTDCATYLKCSNGEYEVVFCGKGLYYNIDLKKCEVDSNNVCWPKVPTCEEGEKTPNPKNCSSYFECKNGELIEKSCGKGLLFNSTLGHCVTDFNNVCWPKPPSCKEGEKLPHPSDCATYLICSNGELKVVWCGKGMYYNSDRKKCEIDSNNVCCPKVPTCEEGEKTPNPKNCSSYFECKNGELIEKSCGKGLLFNSTLGHCVTDFNNVCWPKPPSCKEGEKLPHPSDCATYLICSNGELKVVWCGKGMYYNSDRKKCEIDSNNVCWPKEPTCEEGEKIPNPKNCSSYFECKNGELIEKSCGKGLLFNSTLGHCVTDFNNVCWPKPPSCKEGEKLPHPSDCATYLICSNGELKVVWCGKGMYYNSDRKKCEIDSNNVCWPKVPTCEEGEKTPNPKNCSSYFECKNGELIEKSCGKGLLFNSTLGHCVTDFNNVCWPKPPSCKEGEKLPHPSDCATYLVCSNGELEVVWCGKGMYYNSDRKKCEVDSNNVCWPKEPTCEGGVEEGQMVPNPNNCSSYFRCCHGVLMEESCGKGMLFNTTLKQCVPDVNNICWPKEPACKEGEKLPHPTDCATYLKCSNGEYEVVFCGKGLYYNIDLKKCEVDSNNVCWPQVPTCEEGEKTPNPHNCSSYFECKNGELIEKSCGKGLLFNSTLGHCVTDFNNVCWPKPPSCKEGEKLPHPSDCATYLVCSNGELEVVWCGKGMYYNSDLKKCEVDSNNVCWPKEPTCDNGLEEGETVPNPDNCAGYLICCHGVLTEKLCDDGKFFDTVLEKCVPDDNHVCLPKDPTCGEGMEEGDRIPNPNNCSSYFVCKEDVLKEEYCGRGLFFNSTLGKCQIDSNNVCWPTVPSCEEGAKIPDPNDCASFIICCNGELKIEYCGNDWVYNSTTKECVEDTDNVCWPKKPTCEGGLEEGQKEPNPANCSGYLICCHGVMTEKWCDKDMYFDKETYECVDDVNHSCWPKEQTCKEDEKLPNPDDCASYLLCVNGEYEKVSCGKGMLYNATLEECIEDINYICPKEPTCGEAGIEEGEKIPNPHECFSYFVCHHGELQKESCGEGMLFNATLAQCVDDVNNECWPKDKPTCDGDLKEGEKVENPNNCVSYFVCCNGDLREDFCDRGMYFNNATNQCEEDSNHMCWPQDACEEGQHVQNPSNCSSYFRCCGGSYKLELCDQGLYYNPITKQCTFDVNHVCWPQPVACTCEGQTVGIATQCDKMAICVDGQWQVESCGKGYYFNNVTMKCQPDTQHICWAPEPCKCSGGYEEGEKSPAEDCDKYYTCLNGVQVLGRCGVNMFYNATSKCCERDTEHKCWPNYCAGQVNGTMVTNPQQCDAFYLCSNGEAIEGVCEVGDYFDPKQSSCQPDLDAKCYNPCACESQIKMLPHPDCTKFYFCNGNQTIVKTCPVGGFDATIGECNPEKKCSDNQCEGKPDYYTYEDVKDKTKFYVCLKGVAVRKSCLPNTEYNGQVCAHVTDPDCDPTPCSSLNYALPYPTLNASEVSAFCICRKGYATKQHCMEDYVFDADKQACFTDAACDPLVCKYSPDYTVSLNRKDDKSFCLCTNSKPVTVDCPNKGTFNPVQLACSNGEVTGQCNQLECLNHEDYYTYPDISGSVKGFCMCQGHEGVFHECPKNTMFDVEMRACRVPNIQCDSSKCLGAADNTKIPALITSQGYCECVNNEATYHPCLNEAEFDAVTQQCVEPVCNPTKCVGATDYTRFPAVQSTHGFCMCLNGEVMYRPCDQGGIFNPNMLVCQMPLINCPDSKCLGVNEQDKLPADYSIYGYCTCSRGRATYQECPNGEIFNAVAKSCEKENLPIEQVCDVTYCDDPSHAGQKYPSINNKYGYCVCSSPSGPTFQHCPSGETFDNPTLSCRPTVNSQCDLSLCFHATPTNGYPIPTRTGNTSFCYCTGPTSAMLIDCPANLFYNDRQKKCVAPIEEGCSCPGGLQWGDVIPDVNDCSQYFVCKAGAMHQQSCPPGQYFNADCKKCQDDTNGQCVKKPECTCYGTYREGELVPHPFNAQMYYVCENRVLHEHNCGTGRVFNKVLNQCTREPRSLMHQLQKRSVDVGEFACLETDTRSIPTNCSQYEICHNQKWHLKTCEPLHYYNPEQKQCLEPRDDTVCVYAKVANLPSCNQAREGETHKAPQCQQYYYCRLGKWHLKACGKQEYYNDHISSCLPHHLGDLFECQTLKNHTEILNSSDYCQDLAVRPHNTNCAMYLVCSANQWWLNYCPQGMYFNLTLNYCLMDDENKCLFANTSFTLSELDQLKDACSQEGLLRSSTLACNRYFICMGGQWKPQICAANNFYDPLTHQCSLDAQGKCLQTLAHCAPEEMKVVPGNCSAYQKCNEDRKWLRLDCPQEEVYDDVLRKCISNDGLCSNGGLRRACRSHEIREVKGNCTQFLYCDGEQWTMGSCLEGNMYWPEKQKCVAYSKEDQCKPLLENHLNISSFEKDLMNLCSNKSDGVSIAHAQDCTRYYICVKQTLSQELSCPSGSFFDPHLSYCRPNDGSCHPPLESKECENALANALVAHPTNCQLYYVCSPENGQQLKQCPQGQYFHNGTQQCQMDQGECRGTSGNITLKCNNSTQGLRFAHDAYCNMYLECVKDKAVVLGCPKNYTYNPELQQCEYDAEQRCPNGLTVLKNLTDICGNLTDGSFLPDTRNCTHYYICSQGKPWEKKCSNGTYFNAQQLLCLPHDGTCSFGSLNLMTPEAKSCEGKHGILMADPWNCNNFYVCINGKLRHERCYPEFFYNATLKQCQQRIVLNITTEQGNATTSASIHTINSTQCSANATSIAAMCKEYGEGTSLADQSDCRLYVACEEQGAHSSQRCRNGESFDSLLGFCRQNDGTCQLDSGQRAGECNARHGQLAKDTTNCRKYFTCINGQKIPQTCAEDEYFSKSQNVCLKDTLKSCAVAAEGEQEMTKKNLSCEGLRDTTLYPYIPDNCRSYFQCIQGVAKLQQCADNLYFDPSLLKCVQNQTECIMPQEMGQRSPLLGSKEYLKLCSHRDLERPYANLETHCRSFYTCHAGGEVTHELCPMGKIFDNILGSCRPEADVECM